MRKRITAFLLSILIICVSCPIGFTASAEEAFPSTEPQVSSAPVESTVPKASEETAEPVVPQQTEIPSSEPQAEATRAPELPKNTEWTYEDFEYEGQQGLSLTGYSGGDADVYVPAEIDGKPVLKLGDGLFRGNLNVNSVTLSTNVKVIGTETFMGAEKMVCIVTNESLAEIGDRAFSGCANFNSIVLYDAVTKIGADAFSGCENVAVYCNEGSNAYNYAKSNDIKYVLMNSSAEPEIIEQDGLRYYILNGSAILMYAYEPSETVIVPSEINGYPVTKINTGAFNESHTVSSVVLPDTVTSMGVGVFQNCDMLQSIRLPLGITEIPVSAFSGCNSLKEINIPEGVTRIGGAAFYECETITTAILPQSLKRIDNNVFSYCYNLENIDIPSGVEFIGSYSFENCHKIRTVTIPQNITEITYGVFCACHSLENVFIPSNVKSIMGDAFSYCGSLKTVELSEGLESIISYAFEGCASLSLVTFPQSLNYISDDAFDEIRGMFARVPENSYAYTYAIEHSIPYIFLDENIDDVKYIENGITYYVRDGKAAVLHCSDTVEGDITIPDTVNGATADEVYGYTFFNNSKLSNVHLPDTIKKIDDYAFSMCTANINIPANLSEIGDYAFEFSGITNAEIPEGTKTIGNKAFQFCDKLTSVSLPGSLEYIPSCIFVNCDKLKDVTIMPGPKYIEDNAFAGCSSIETLAIPEGVTKIDYSAFQSCKMLRTLYLPDSLEELYPNVLSDISCVVCVNEDSFGHKYAVENEIPYYINDGAAPEIYVSDGMDYYIMDGEAVLMSCIEEKTETATVLSVVNEKPVTSINQCAFCGCKIKSVALPNTIKRIGRSAFAQCYNLTDIDLSDISVTRISDRAFSNCGKLNNIVFPDNLVSIGSGVFDGCKALESVTIPESVTSFGEAAFYWCSSLKSINLPVGIETLPDSVFLGCSALETLDIPDSVRSIGKSAFYACDSLDNIVLPEKLESIAPYTFAHCRSLRSIVIPRGIKYIPENLFDDCTSLEAVEIPDSVNRIDGFAFSGCTAIESINIPNTVQSMSYSVFTGCSSLKRTNIPKNLTEFSGCLFNGCTSLQPMYISDKICKIASDAFRECPNFIMCVFEDSYPHHFAVENNVPYFIIPRTENPNVSNGTGVSGYVTSLLGSPVSQATVELIDKDGNVLQTVSSDEYGFYQFTYAYVGSYTVRASDAQGNTGINTFSVKRLSAFDVYVTDGTNVTINDCVSIYGTVTNENGEPINSVYVELIDENGNVINGAYTSSDGGYEFEYVPAGTYTVRATDYRNENAAMSEVAVFPPNGDILCDIAIRESASVSGRVTFEGGEPATWVEVIVTNEEGDRVQALNTDSSGRYNIHGLPAGRYNITVAVEKDNRRYMGATDVTVVGAVDITDADIVLKSESAGVGAAKVSGKVTAHGSPQPCVVVIKDVFMNEIATYTTGKNGKYTFVNIPDGAYTIIATTESNGAGYTSITITDGEITAGSTDITVYKEGTVEDLETRIDLLPDPDSGADAIAAALDDIEKAKNIYDGMSDKSKRQLDEEKLDKLNRLIAAAAAPMMSVSNDGALEYSASAQGLETVISGNEILQQKTSDINLNIAVYNAPEEGEEQPDSKYDIEQIDKKAANENKTIVDYFDISLTKTTDGVEKKISDIKKDSAGTGKIRITLALPDEHKNHVNYYMLHIHNGSLSTLADMDSDPDTVTFETDKFSKFAMIYDDIERIETVLDAEIFNLPENDYARVNAGSDSVKIGDTVAFYKDEDMTEQFGEAVEITEDTAKIALPEGALNKQAGTLYARVNGAEPPYAVEYPVELGFEIKPDSITVEVGKTVEAELIGSDEAYAFTADWSVENENVSIEANGLSATITGKSAGATKLSVTAEFAHPDTLADEKTIELTKSVDVTVTDLAAPDAPTESPSAEPSQQPTSEPTESSSAEPSQQPTSEPTESPSAEPSQQPTSEPTESPSAEPSQEPTSEPTESPSAEPSQQPTSEPTKSPTAEPSQKPTSEPTESPSAEPSQEPTSEPTESPSAEPSQEPTSEPTESPSVEPSQEPTSEPTESPSAEPSQEPTSEPTYGYKYLIDDIRVFDGSISVDITALTGGEAKLIVASYTEGGLLADIEFVDIAASGTFDAELITDNADSVSAFVWNNISDAVPLCDKKVKKIK